MAKEHVTLKFLGLEVSSFTATKPGRRGENDAEELFKQFLKSGLRVLVSNTKEGYFIVASVRGTTERLMMERNVKRCFTKAGYKITKSP